MLRPRIIPCLLIKNRSLIKTIRFRKYQYIGDPVNTVKIFNELEVDELMFLDIYSSSNNHEINYNLLQDVSSEAFMPLSYGGNIKSLDQAKKIFSLGYEKIVINSANYFNKNIISDISNYFGSQSVIASLDVKKGLLRANYKIFSHNGKKKQNIRLIEFLKYLEDQGAGEILMTSIDRDGTWDGYDIDLLKMVSNSVNLPVIANGGASNIHSIYDALFNGNASACAVGSMVVYQKKDNGVLINFPTPDVIEKLFKEYQEIKIDKI